MMGKLFLQSFYWNSDLKYIEENDFPREEFKWHLASLNSELFKTVNNHMRDLLGIIYLNF